MNNDKSAEEIVRGLEQTAEQGLALLGKTCGVVANPRVLQAAADKITELNDFASSQRAKLLARIAELEAENKSLAINGGKYMQIAETRYEMLEKATKRAEAAEIKLAASQQRERAAVEAINRMADYIVTRGRVDYWLCDDIPEELHIKHQPKNDGNYENAPCIKCVAEYFMRGPQTAKEETKQ